MSRCWIIHLLVRLADCDQMNAPSTESTCPHLFINMVIWHCTTPPIRDGREGSHPVDQRALGDVQTRNYTLVIASKKEREEVLNELPRDQINNTWTVHPQLYLCICSLVLAFFFFSQPSTTSSLSSCRPLARLSLFFFTRNTATRKCKSISSLCFVIFIVTTASFYIHAGPFGLGGARRCSVVHIPQVTDREC